MENNIPESEIIKEENLLVAEDYVHYVYATQGQRFLNWLIDNLLMRLGLGYLSGIALGFILALVAPDFLREIAYTVNSGGSIFSSFKLFAFLYMISILNYLFYYTICEKVFKGYTLGKLITGTRAIRQDGAELTFRDAFLRSAIRLVPFEIFSGFNTMTWHDSWTDTMVIKSR
jgi:uncharacterized RDD family membrane protein YckC